MEHAESVVFPGAYLAWRIAFGGNNHHHENIIILRIDWQPEVSSHLPSAQPSIVHRNMSRHIDALIESVATGVGMAVREGMSPFLPSHQ
jgi:hypothetical protein